MTVEEVLKRKTREDNFAPIEYETFLSMDDSEKAWYINTMISRFNTTDTMIGWMMGVNRSTISRWAKKLGTKKRSKIEDTAKSKQAFFDWIEQWRGKMEPGWEQEKFVEQEPENSTVGELHVLCGLGDVAAMLQAIALRDSGKYIITVYWNAVTVKEE